MRFEFENWLAPSRYTLTPSVSDAGRDEDTVVAPDLAALVVEAPLKTGGVADFPTTFEVIRR